jgi:glycosyltransferase involved in cell wall biosynthesis
VKNKKKIKKIAILMENIEYGGATTHLVNLINSKSFKDINFCIITNRGNKAVKSILHFCHKKNVKIFYYNSLFIPYFKNKILKLFHYIFKPILFIISIIQMHNFLKKISYDLILANLGGYGDFRSELSALIAAKIQKKEKSFLLIHHCYSKPFFWNNLINKFLSLIIGKLVRGIIFVSNATKKNISKNTNLLKFSKSKIKVIHNGVNTKVLNENKIRLFNSGKKKIKVLMLSRIESYKGHEDMIEAFSILPQKIKLKYKIFFVGSGDPIHIKKLKNQINDLRLNKYFKFFNYLNYNSIRIFKSVDIFFSLTRDFEAFGYSIAESLLAETPVVSTKVGGVVEFLNKENSELIETRNTKQINQIFIEFIKKRKYFKNKAIKGKLLIKKKFNSDLMGKNFYVFLNKNL